MPDLNDPEGHGGGLCRWPGDGLDPGPAVGFVTLGIDFVTDGDRIEPGQRPLDSRQFYKRYPDPMADDAWSLIGKDIWDVMRSVDYLQSLPLREPEAHRLYRMVLGRTRDAFCSSASTNRIAAAVPNGGVLDWHRPTYPAELQGKIQGQRLDPAPRARWSHGRLTGREAFQRCGLPSPLGLHPEQRARDLNPQILQIRPAREP